MRTWQGVLKSDLNSAQIAGSKSERGTNAIRQEGLDPAKPYPNWNRSLISQAPHGDQFVIALQKHALVRRSPLDQSIDCSSGEFAPVNVITQENVNRPSRLVPHQVGVYQRKKLVQQVGAPVDVTNH